MIYFTCLNLNPVAVTKPVLVAASIVIRFGSTGTVPRSPLSE